MTAPRARILITFIVEAVLAILLVIILMTLFRKRKAAAPAALPQPDLSSLKPTEAHQATSSPCRAPGTT